MSGKSKEYLSFKYLDFRVMIFLQSHLVECDNLKILPFCISYFLELKPRLLVGLCKIAASI